MEILLKFTPQEDEYLIKAKEKHIKISRMAIRLNRPYYMVQARLLVLGLISEKEINRTKFYTQDEIDYNLLLEGATEEEIEKLRGSKTVFPSHKPVSSFSDDE